MFQVHILVQGIAPVELQAYGVEGRGDLLLGRDFLAKLKLVLAVDFRKQAGMLGEGSLLRSAFFRLLSAF
jgi:hypothetical protein